MNMTVLQVDNKYYFIDGGGLFPDARVVGVDLIIPDTQALIDAKIEPEAWIITHGHEDHIGAMPWLYGRFPAPIYAYGFATELLREKMRERGLGQVEMREWQVGKKNPVTGGISVTPFPVNHSIPDSLGLFIETKYGNILHPGDHRIDQTPPEGILTTDSLAKAIAGKRVDVLMSDSTNSFSQGRDKNEIDLRPSFEHISSTTKGLVLATTFASNVWRLKTLAEAARKTGRKVVLVGRSLKRNYEIATRRQIISFPEGLFVPEERVSYHRRSELLVLCTGSQGEPNSGLYRVVTRGLGDFYLDESDAVVFSSRSIPGNERSIGDVINLIARRGSRVITARDADIHVSGHGYQEDLKDIIKRAKPRYFVPVHGEYRHLKQHAKLAMEVGVAPENCFVTENGDWLRIDGDTPGIFDRVDSGRDYICAGGPLSEKSEVYRERLQVGKIGVIHAFFTVDEAYDILLAEPKLTYLGVTPLDEDKNVYVREIFEETLADAKMKKNFCNEKFEESVRLRLRRFFESNIGYKSKVMVVVQRLT